MAETTILMFTFSPAFEFFSSIPFRASDSIAVNPLCSPRRSNWFWSFCGVAKFIRSPIQCRTLIIPKVRRAFSSELSSCAFWTSSEDFLCQFFLAL